MKPQYEAAVIEGLENSYGVSGGADLAVCLLETAKAVAEDIFEDYYTDLCASRADSRYNDGEIKSERSVEHGNDVQDRGGLPTAQSGGTGGPAGREVWDAAAEQGATEELKASNQMKWVGLMNNIRASAEEIALKELVYN